MTQIKNDRIVKTLSHYLVKNKKKKINNVHDDNNINSNKNDGNIYNWELEYEHVLLKLKNSQRLLIASKM